MITKSITYKNLFDGQMHTKTFYFHLSVPEMAKLQVSVKGGYGEYLDKLIKENDQKNLFEQFENLILTSYGVKTEDGEWNKSPELRQKFYDSPAYAALFTEMITNETAAADFINGVIPKSEIDKITRNGQHPKQGLVPPLPPSA